MEIDITDLFQALAETNLMLFSASPAEMGEDAGSHTWANCMDLTDQELCMLKSQYGDTVYVTGCHLVGEFEEC